LVARDYPKSLNEAIGKLSDRSPIVRVAAVESIGAVGTKKTAAHVIKRLADPNGEVRMTAAEALAALLKNGHCPRELILSLKDSNELVRVAAAETLGLIGDRRALPAARRALHDSSPLVRSYAAAAIGQLGEKRDVAKLRKAVRSEESEIAKVGFYAGLHSLGEYDVLEALLKLLDEGSDYRARCAVANTLPELGLNQSDTEKSVRHLRRALRHESTVAARSSIRSSLRHMSD